MGIAITLLTWWRGRLIGEDGSGNRYYEDHKRKLYGRPRRWVVYKGAPEASKVPSDWHGWLHHTLSDPPKFRQSYAWEKGHLPNLTGTPLAHSPKKGKGEASEPYLRLDYEPWKPGSD